MARVVICCLLVATLSIGQSEAAFSDDTSSSGGFAADTLQAPTGLGASGTYESDLTWTVTPDGYSSGYRVLRGSSSGGPYVEVGTVGPVSATSHTDLAPAGTHYYVLRSYFGNWDSVDSNEVSISTLDDYDAVAATSDVCPGTYDVLQIDSDGDGTGDLCDSSPTAASGSFTNSGTALSAAYRNPAVGDLDGDGDLDLALATTSATSILLNNGSGTFTDTGQSLGGSTINIVALGDVDSDADLDLLMGTSGGAGSLVYVNDGTGTFTDSGQSLGSAATFSLALVDVDGDLDLDKIAINYTPRPAAVWLNNGSGTFTDSGQALGTGGELTAGSIGYGDFDGDRDIDFVVGRRFSAPNQIWLNDGTGTFTAGQGVGTSSTTAIGAVDVDGDGDLDHVYCNNGGNEVWSNNGSGTYTLTQSFGSYWGQFHNCAMADFDGDGDWDMVQSPHPTSASNVIWWNNGSGQFTSSTAIGSNGEQLIVGDFTGDSKVDVLIQQGSASDLWTNS